LKTSFCKDNGSLTGDTILFFKISQELWNFKKLGYITKKGMGRWWPYPFRTNDIT